MVRVRVGVGVRVHFTCMKLQFYIMPIALSSLNVVIINNLIANIGLERSNRLNNEKTLIFIHHTTLFRQFPIFSLLLCKVHLHQLSLFRNPRSLIHLCSPVQIIAVSTLQTSQASVLH